MNFNVDLATILQAVVAVMIVLWGLGEGLTRLGVTFKSENVTKIGKLLGVIFYWAGRLLGLFGLGSPSIVIEEKAAKKVAEEGK